MTALLSIFQVDNPVQQILLKEDRRYAVGRDPSCAICIDDPEISRTHACLEFCDSRWMIRDNSSKNGLSVSGKLTDETQLADDTWIGIGTLALRFEMLTPEQEKSGVQTERWQRQLTLDGRRRMNDSNDISQVLENLLSSTLSVSATSRAFVMLTQDDGDMRVACSQNGRGKSFEHHEFIGSASAVEMAITTRKPVVTCDAALHQQFGLKASIIGAQTRALVCLPMTLFGRVLGVIYADSREPGKIFTDLDLKLLGELADHAALVVAAAQLDEKLDQVDSQMLNAERLRKRVATQQNLIPDVGHHSPHLARKSATGVSWSWIESQR